MLGRMKSMVYPWLRRNRFFFNSPLLLLEDGSHSRLEPRLHALGKSDEERLLHITLTLRRSGQLIRVISARDMH